MQALVIGALVGLVVWSATVLVGMRGKAKEQGKRIAGLEVQLASARHEAAYDSAKQWRAIGALQEHTACESAGKPMDDWADYIQPKAASRCE